MPDTREFLASNRHEQCKILCSRSEQISFSFSRSNLNPSTNISLGGALLRRHWQSFGGTFPPCFSFVLSWLDICTFFRIFFTSAWRMFCSCLMLREIDIHISRYDLVSSSRDHRILHVVHGKGRYDQARGNKLWGDAYRSQKVFENTSTRCFITLSSFGHSVHGKLWSVPSFTGQ